MYMELKPIEDVREGEQGLISCPFLAAQALKGDPRFRQIVGLDKWLKFYTNESAAWGWEAPDQGLTELCQRVENCDLVLVYDKIWPPLKPAMREVNGTWAVNGNLWNHRAHQQLEWMAQALNGERLRREQHQLQATTTAAVEEIPANGPGNRPATLGPYVTGSTKGISDDPAIGAVNKDNEDKPDRTKYKSEEKFEPQGLNVNPLKIPEGRVLLAELKNADPNASQKTLLMRARTMLQTCKQVPKVETVSSNTPLYKIVPTGENVTPYSPYFMSKKQLEELSKNPTEAANIMGLPNQSVALQYDVYQIKPKSGQAPTVFISEVAPIKQGSVTRAGGGDQIIIPNRSMWSDAVIIGTIGK